MNIKDLINNYDLKEWKINKIEYRNNTLYLTVNMNIQMDYIANGCRPFFDYQVNHLFIFEDQSHKDLIIDTSQLIIDYKYSNNILKLKLTNLELSITDCNVICKNNI